MDQSHNAWNTVGARDFCQQIAIVFTGLADQRHSELSGIAFIGITGAVIEALWTTVCRLERRGTSVAAIGTEAIVLTGRAADFFSQERGACVPSIVTDAVTLIEWTVRFRREANGTIEASVVAIAIGSINGTAILRSKTLWTFKASIVTFAVVNVQWTAVLGLKTLWAGVSTIEANTVVKAQRATSSLVQARWALEPVVVAKAVIKAKRTRTRWGKVFWASKATIVASAAGVESVGFLVAGELVSTRPSVECDGELLWSRCREIGNGVDFIPVLVAFHPEGLVQGRFETFTGIVLGGNLVVVKELDVIAVQSKE